MRSSYRLTLSLIGDSHTKSIVCTDSDGAIVQCTTKDWDLKEEMQEWDVDDEAIAKLTAIDEEAKRVPAENWGHCSSNKAEPNF